MARWLQWPLGTNGSDHAGSEDGIGEYASTNWPRVPYKIGVVCADDEAWCENTSDCDADGGVNGSVVVEAAAAGLVPAPAQPNTDGGFKSSWPIRSKASATRATSDDAKADGSSAKMVAEWSMTALTRSECLLV